LADGGLVFSAEALFFLYGLELILFFPKTQGGNQAFVSRHVFLDPLWLKKPLFGFYFFA